MWKRNKTQKFTKGNSESWTNSKNETLLVSKSKYGWIVTLEEGYYGTTNLSFHRHKKDAMEWAIMFINKSTN